jgi:hypothetical protein
MLNTSPHWKMACTGHFYAHWVAWQWMCYEVPGTTLPLPRFASSLQFLFGWTEFQFRSFQSVYRFRIVSKYYWLSALKGPNSMYWGCMIYAQKSSELGCIIETGQNILRKAFDMYFHLNVYLYTGGRRNTISDLFPCVLLYNMNPFTQYKSSGNLRCLLQHHFCN